MKSFPLIGLLLILENLIWSEDQDAQEFSIMPIPSYSGETCVAFLDIYGFKRLMERGIKAEEALDKFYSTIFRVNRDFDDSQMNVRKIRSLIVSDCSVVFVDNTGLTQDEISDVKMVLRFVQKVNQELLVSSGSLSILTTCSVDYGPFKYEDRIEFEGLGKDYFFGKPYVAAFLDNEKLRNRPGYCRVIRKNLEISEISRNVPPLSLLETDGDYYYFYWMLNSLSELASFKRQYEDVSESTYRNMGTLLRSFKNSARHPAYSDAPSQS
jgi:hypothetical protein